VVRRRHVDAVIMQRCYQLDLSGHLVEQGWWEHLCLPAEYEGSNSFTSIGFTDPRETRGELLWRNALDRTRSPT
jgi:hypothetical protein